MEYKYKTKGTCATEVIVELDGDLVKSVRFVGGCKGNTAGIGALVQGMKVEDVIERCKGIHCGAKPTSCPDQLAQALVQALEQPPQK